MASRTYTAGLRDLGPGGYPFGTTDVNLAARYADDSMYLVLPNDPVGGSPDAFMTAAIDYDYLIPPSSQVDSFTYSTRFAQTYDGAAMLSTNSGFGFAYLPIPGTLGQPGVLPDTWTEAETVFNSDNSFVLPYSSATYWIENVLQVNPFDWTIQLSGYSPSGVSYLNLFVDQATVTVGFTLALPTATTTVYDIRRNRLSFLAQLVGAGMTNSTYPWTVWFEYTLADPSSDSYDSDSVNARVWTTDKQTYYTNDPEARDHVVQAATPPDLLPNTTYYVRAVVENADSEQATSSWVSATTLKFDPARSH